MASKSVGRYDRFHKEDSKAGEHRSPSQRDRDRIIYTSAFRRLAEVTQVVAANNAHVFHNRLTHSLQVAQVGRRIAEILLKRPPTSLRSLGDICPDVVETSCLAHDLGHPPFGHVAEQELNRLCYEYNIPDGFEGNAQSFRIVTKLAFRSTHYSGLNLTHATLGAILKYPWFQSSTSSKWGAYRSEAGEFRWARTGIAASSKARTLEAEIMDWADDVTYSIHDLEDFYRAGRIPLHLLNSAYSRERQAFFDDVFERRKKADGVWQRYSRSELEQAFESVIAFFQLEEPYSATKDQRAQLRRFTGEWIGRYINAVQVRSTRDLSDGFLEIDPMAEKQVAMLKELTWHYVINDTSMASQQHGQRKVIRKLFEIFYSAAKGRNRNLNLFPMYYRELLREAPSSEAGRIVVDMISGMTERQAIAMYRRFAAIRLGSAFDLILQ